MRKIQDLPYKEQFTYIQDYFSALEFNEELHRYSLPDKKIKRSVSAVYKDFIPKTDFYNIARNIDRKQGIPEGTTMRLWDLKGKESTAKGTKAHFFAEIYAKYPVLQPETGYESAIKLFIDNLPKHVIVAFTELTMYHKEYLFAGTADLILYDIKKNTYFIADWKTNVDLYKAYGKLLSPFNTLENNSLNKYSLQFSLYQILLEQTCVKVQGRALIWIKKDGTYETISLPNRTKKLIKYLNKKCL